MGLAGRWASTVALALVATWVAGCAILDSSTTVHGEIVLPAGGGADGRVRVVGGDATEILLENLGPGEATVLMQEDERSVMHGPLGRSRSLVFDSEGDHFVTIEVRATGNGHATISWTVRSENGASVEWMTVNGDAAAGPE